MTATEIKAKIFDLQEENKILKTQVKNFKKQIKERMYQLSDEYFLSVEVANATALKEIVSAYEESLKKILQNNKKIEDLKEKLKLLEE